MKHWNLQTAVVCIGLFPILGVATLQAQKDPGPRKGPANAGGYYSTLNEDEQATFTNGLGQFQESNDSVPRENGNGGLGPGFNGNSCTSCHAQPASLGSSPSPNSPQVPQPNPEIAAGQSMGATNVIPSFIKADAPG